MIVCHYYYSGKKIKENTMRLNENIKIVGQNVILVPYERIHVDKYHQWMQNPELQQLTASEPLTLEEEYEMQKSWREDEDKLTFLVLSKDIYNKTNDEIKALIGDTNIFLYDDEDHSGEKVAEAEIMIAESSARGKGCGWEAMLLLLKYGQQNLKVIRKFAVKIGMENTKSLRMFEKMQFKEVSRSEVFQEVTMECPITAEWLNWLDSKIALKCEAYR